MDKKVQLPFSEFTLNDAPENKFVWSGNLVTNNSFFEGEIPVCIISNEKEIEETMVHFIEGILLHIEEYLHTAIVFLIKTFNDEAVKYKIQPQEIQYLNLKPEDFPLDFPEITFWQDSDREWMIRFSEGKFDICDPYGIAVNFKRKKIIGIENLEDCEPI